MRPGFGETTSVEGLDQPIATTGPVTVQPQDTDVAWYLAADTSEAESVVEYVGIAGTCTILFRTTPTQFPLKNTKKPHECNPSNS